MPFLAPFLPSIVSGVGGAIAGGIGQSGQQGRTRQETEQQRRERTLQELTGTTSRRGTRDINQLAEQFESPEATEFRRGMFPRFEREFARAEQPIFGEAQKAGFLTNLNQLAGAAGDSLKQQLSAAGALDSGRFAAGLGDIEMGRAGQASQFFSQLPFMEQQARSQRLNDLFSGATGFLASGPRSTRTTGTEGFEETGEEQRRATGETEGTTTGTTTGTEFGPSAGRSILTNLGGLGMGFAGQMFPQSKVGGTKLPTFNNPMDLGSLGRTPPLQLGAPWFRDFTNTQGRR